MATMFTELSPPVRGFRPSSRSRFMTPRVHIGWRATILSLRRELTDRMLIVSRRQLEHALTVYVDHYNRHRPHRSLGQTPPSGRIPPSPSADYVAVVRRDRLGGLIYEYEYPQVA
jgi:putative transposase